ncbi:PREDICTED: inactive protein RESTRICTED TEV MOVEMENT 2-like [Ipomoea nil]|uniref:inactive protein RESTRICTED TEV MOVEMENT 2-like n=1 Tax=Ipomoea nil TaxID=35883 RepID=UPI000900B624|nr:PREDICTED: inactive protein RESTRICTED TEV MOVEMENT 2-like [Ipomoea nil]
MLITSKALCSSMVILKRVVKFISCGCSRARTPSPVCKDFVPRSELYQDADADVLRLYLPDFNEEQVKVEVTRPETLSVSGLRPTKGDRWVRFHREFPVSANCNQSEISHEFKGGILCVRQPKLTEKQYNLTQPEPSQPQKLAAPKVKGFGRPRKFFNVALFSLLLVGVVLCVDNILY